ncbi:tyrosine recombinase XerC [Blastococcus sp. TF02A-26]|uniref:site-specific integrase n=1 Tax=Blastococcus sp. TF02A-26 TaxID=2250577 RepID=UPI000DE9756F|nr:site-specific integrase [Blastococcus sp. TF02A-26]RBY87456.1 site-specific integrase [Blastococcus sp. TF02A-26]
MARRSFGSVRRLPSGRYQASYLGPDGKRRTGPQTFIAKGDATRWLSRIETELSAGTWVDPVAGQVTLRAYAAAWLAQRTVRGRPLAPRTLQTYQHSLDAWLLPPLGDHRLSAITPAVVRTWHAATLSATGPTATRQAYALLRSILSTAMADDAIARNPCRITGAGQPSSPERPLLDLDTVLALIDAMPVYLRTATATIFWAHLRIGEAVALQRRDVDLSAATLRIERQHVEIRSQGPVETAPKVASQRTIALPNQAVALLGQHLHDHPGLPQSYLFTRRDGSQLRAMHVQNAWQTARKKVARPDVHLHDLRHAGLTLTAQLGGTLAEVQRRAGHASARAALIYQHAAASRDQDLAALLSKLG